MACLKCVVRNIEFIVICRSQVRLLQFLINHGILNDTLNCGICGKCCVTDWERNEFRCQRTNPKKKSKHYFTKSVFNGTFFSGTHVPLKSICLFVMIWISRGPPRQKFIQRELGMSSTSVVYWSSICREVLIDWAFKQANHLGGEGEIVEIYEAKIVERKCNRALKIKGQWVFVAVLRSDPKKIFVVPVQEKKADSLVPILQKWILPGTTIISDFWKAYDCLDNEGYKHLKVNHSLNFVDADCGAHTQNIERFWREINIKVPRHGQKKEHYVGYLCELMFKRAYPDHRDRLHYFFKAAAFLYTPQ